MGRQWTAMCVCIEGEGGIQGFTQECSLKKVIHLFSAADVGATWGCFLTPPMGIPRYSLHPFSTWPRHIEVCPDHVVKSIQIVCSTSVHLNGNTPRSRWPVLKFPRIKKISSQESQEMTSKAGRYISGYYTLWHMSLRKMFNFYVGGRKQHATHGNKDIW